MFLPLFTACLLATSALAHSYIFRPTPRQNDDFEYTDINENGCGSANTSIPDENKFQRGQKIPVKCVYFRLLPAWS